MRITGGQFRGRRLSTPTNNDIRPTSDKVRAAIFNALGSRIDFNGLRVLDAYCGTGSLGLEALSRGAAHTVFRDISLTSLKLAQANVKQLGLEAQATFELGDSSKSPLLRTQKTEDHFFDLVFIDPPYRKNLILPLCQSLITQNSLKPGSLLIIESEKNLDLESLENLMQYPPTPDQNPIPPQIVFDKTYGDTHIRFFECLRPLNRETL